jgi:hypothetical protein
MYRLRARKLKEKKLKIIKELEDKAEQEKFKRRSMIFESQQKVRRLKERRSQKLVEELEGKICGSKNKENKMHTAIGSYVHGDDVNKRKGGCQVIIAAETDFAVRTDSFVAFCDFVAMRCYAIIKSIPEESLFEDVEGDEPYYGVCFTWAELAEQVHSAKEIMEDILTKKYEIEKELGEDIDIIDITCII